MSLCGTVNADRARLLVMREMITARESCITYLLEARDDNDADAVNNEDQSPW